MNPSALSFPVLARVSGRRWVPWVSAVAVGSAAGGLVVGFTSPRSAVTVGLGLLVGVVAAMFTRWLFLDRRLAANLFASTVVGAMGVPIAPIFTVVPHSDVTAAGNGIVMWVLWVVIVAIVSAWTSIGRAWLTTALTLVVGLLAGAFTVDVYPAIGFLGLIVPGVLVLLLRGNVWLRAMVRLPAGSTRNSHGPSDAGVSPPAGRPLTAADTAVTD